MGSRTGRFAGVSVLAVALILAASGSGASDGGPAAERERSPSGDEFLFVPLQLHVLSAPGLPEVDCRLKDEDLARILRKVNAIWHHAGIHWAAGDVAREEAAGRERFEREKVGEGARRLSRYRVLVPEPARKGNGLHVFYLHELPVNGVWMGTNFALVKETARLRKVPGGIDEPIPRVTAHELGHALGLPHRQDTTNLLASGTTGTSLNAVEVETARRKAREVRGVLTLAELRKAAEAADAAGDRDRSRRLRAWLAEIPEAGAPAGSHDPQAKP